MSVVPLPCSASLRGVLVATAAALIVTVPGTAASAAGPPSPVGGGGSLAAPPVIVVALTGDDSAPGTVDRPLRSVQRAIDLARPGTVISVRAGTYTPVTNYQVTTSGTAAAPITLQAYPGEAVLLDGERLPYTPAPVGGSLPNAARGVLHLERVSYWRIVGLQVANGPYGVYCRDCDHIVFDRLVTRDNYETGLQIQGASSGNQVIDLDSFGNRDPRKNGESADGLAIKEGSGAGNIVRGARLWHNVDDGFDAWEFLSPITIDGSLAWGNGVDRWGFPDFAGDGNGFKLGGGDDDLPAGHTVRHSIAFDNAQGGFIDNGNPGTLQLDHDTAWRNGGTGFDLADSAATVTKSLSVANRVQATPGSAAGGGNSWNLGGSWPLAGTDPGVATGPRTADGHIAGSPFLRPASGADVGARF